MSDGMKGMLTGALIGCFVAWSNWQGDVGAAVGLVVVAAAMGFTAAYFLGKRRKA